MSTTSSDAFPYLDRANLGVWPTLTGVDAFDLQLEGKAPQLKHLRPNGPGLNGIRAALLNHGHDVLHLEVELLLRDHRIGMVVGHRETRCKTAGPVFPSRKLG